MEEKGSEERQRLPQAVMKQKPEDFIVEEITPDGTLLEIGAEYVFDRKSRGDFLVFVLEKKDTDTFIALKNIAGRLRIPEGKLSVAGIKDKCAITSQRASLHKIKKEALENVSIENIKIKPLCYGSKVYLGALKANRFTITLRCISLGSASVRKHIEKRIASLGSVFPNYYGEQRFGGKRPATHLVGKQIVAGNARLAVEIYIGKTFDSDSKEMRATRENAFKDLKKAYVSFPASCTYEREMILHLIENPGDFTGALRKLPSGLLKMFIGAYQAHIFNIALSGLVRDGKAEKSTSIPLPGYLFSSRIFSNIEDEYVEKALKKEKTTPGMFRIGIMPEISSEGDKRRAFAPFYGFEILEVSKDELNPGKSKAVLRFALEKGSYATVFLKELFNA